MDVDGDIYVADAGNDRVQLFNQEGRFVQKFVGDATLSKSARAYMLSNPMFLRLRDMASIDAQKYFRRPRSVRVDEKGQMFVPGLRLLPGSDLSERRGAAGGGTDCGAPFGPFAPDGLRAVSSPI